MYADDTNIFYTGTTLYQMKEQVQEDSENLNVWLKSNKLVVNSNKIKYMIFRSHRKTVNTDIDLLFTGHKVTEVFNCKDLDVYLSGLFF